MKLSAVYLNCSNKDFSSWSVTEAIVRSNGRNKELEGEAPLTNHCLNVGLSDADLPNADVGKVRRFGDGSDAVRTSDKNYCLKLIDVST